MAISPRMYLASRCPTLDKGKAALDFNVRKTIDPEARRLITGIPRLLMSALPFEILQTPERLGTFHYLSWHRWVWLDGRQPEADPDPRYLGNAVGHWDGDTLVIESNGLQGQCRRQVLARRQRQSAELAGESHGTLAPAGLPSPRSRADLYRSDLLHEASDLHAALGDRRRGRSAEGVLLRVEHDVGREPPRARSRCDRTRRQSGLGPNGQIVPDLPLGSVTDASRGTGYWLYRKNKPKPSDLPAGS